MGRMKEIYIQIMNANNGIPEEITLADMLQMRDLNIYHWKEYERTKERNRTQITSEESPVEVINLKKPNKNV